MAEQDANKLNVTSYEKGLHQDFSPNRQPKGTYRFALNTVSESSEGDLGYRVNERSNEAILPLSDSSDVVMLGNHYIGDFYEIIFYVNTTTGNSYISKLNTMNNTLEVLVESDCLNFNKNYQIEATHRVKNGCDTIIYFVDHFNPDRALDISNLDNYIRSNYVDGVDPTESKWNCAEFNIDRVATDVYIDNTTINENGSLPAGTIQFALQHLDGNKNGAGYTIPTMPIPLVDDSYTVYNDIDGVSVDNPVTNKAVTLDIFNVDENYEFLEIIAIVTTEGVTTAYSVAEVPISGSTFQYTVDRIRTTDSRVELVQLTVPREILSSKTITQIENRLIRANTKCSNYDYSDFQRDYANNITSKYVVQTVSKNSLTDSVKTPEYYDTLRSYMRDEVYAFGIVYKHADGTESPVFHIPGRAKDSIPSPSNHGNHRPQANAGWDSSTYTGVASGADNLNTVLNDNYFSGTERWEICNTAYRIDATSGYMAYHETNVNYPSTTDCNGNPIYGALAGTPIRHHRFPDAALVPHYQSNNIYPLGITFENISLPPGTVSYRIVRADRTDENKTVLDKGIATYARQIEIDNTTINFQPFFYNKHKSNDNPPVGVVAARTIVDGPEAGDLETDPTLLNVSLTRRDLLCFHSPGTKFKTPALNPIECKTEMIMHSAVYSNQGEGPDSTSTLTEFDTEAFDIITYPTGIFRNRILSTAYVGANSITNVNLPNKFVNNYAQETFGIYLDSDCDVKNVTYDVNSNSELDIVQDAAGSPILNSVTAITYYALKRGDNVYTDLSNIEYITTGDTWNSLATVNRFGGDTFISRMDFIQSARVKTNANALANSNFDYGDGTSGFSHNYTNIISYWGENTINSELRHALQDQNYYPKSPGTVLLGDKSIANDGSSYTPNWYNYNDDYSKQPTDKIFVGLSNNYKYCDACPCQFPNRVRYSEQALQEEISDNYLTFRTNNYRDVAPNKGPITKIFNYNNKLYIDTEESRFYLPSTTQAMRTQDETVFIGTGEFFSIPVQELVDKSTGFLGSQSQWAHNTTEYGVFSVDAANGKVFLFKEGGNQIISNNGLRNWFSENLPLELPRDYKRITGEDFPFEDNPAYTIGFTSAYDNRLERWILTKHDYRITAAGEAAINTLPGEELYFEDGQWKFSDGVEVTTINPADTPNYFENVSWTISYSAKDNSWTSWHSYLPNYYIDSKVSLYSFINSSQSIWRHHKKFEYQTFYGTQYDHIIEFVASRSPLIADIYNAVNFHTQAQQWDSTNKTFIDKRLITFDKAILYNSYQCSGELTLLTQREQTFARRQEVIQNQMLLDVNEKEYSFNSFRDLVSDRELPIFTKDWNLAEYNGEYFIDKVINPSVINLNKNWWEQEVFRDKYLVIRLFFTNFANTKLITNLSTQNLGYSEG